MKLYESKEWLKRKYIIEGKSIDEIAQLCSVSHMSIRRALEKFGLK